MQGSKTMFWSLFFICLGVLLLIQHILKIDLPLFRIFLGLFLLYLGFKIIFGSFGIKLSGVRGLKKIKTESEHVFHSGEFKLYSNKSDEKKFTTVFGTTVLDLTQNQNFLDHNTITAENIFSKTTILTPGDFALKVDADIAFGQVTVRGKKLGSLGEVNFTTSDYESNPKKLNLSVDAVFGEIEIK